VKSIGSIAKAHSWTIISFGAGAILIALGIARIVGSLYGDWRWILTNDPSVDAGIFYPAWNEFEVATGIILTVAGTIACAVALAYAILRRKAEGIQFRPVPR